MVTAMQLSWQCMDIACNTVLILGEVSFLVTHDIGAGQMGRDSTLHVDLKSACQAAPGCSVD